MKTALLIDMFVQIAIFITAVLIGFSVFQVDADAGILTCYFVMGSWQILSFFTYYFLANPHRLRMQRKAFSRTLIILIGLAVLVLLIHLLGDPSYAIIFLFFLLIYSPFSAAWYFSICWREWKILKMEKLVHLK